MEEQRTRDRNIVLKGVAGGLNAIGSALVYTYDSGAQGVGAVFGLVTRAPAATRQAFRSRPCFKESRVSEQILRKIEKYEKRLADLHKELGQGQAAAENVETYAASEEGASLLEEIKDLEANVAKLKKRLVEIEENKKANALLKQELKVYKKRSSVATKRHKKQYKQVIKSIEQAIEESLEKGALFSDFDKDLFQTVVSDLLDHEMEIKILAASKLGEMKEALAVPVLLAALEFDEPELLSELIKALASIGDKTVLPVLKELTSDPQYRVRLSAFGALCEMVDSNECVEYLLKAMHDGHPEVRMAAVKLLGWQEGQDVVDELVQCIEDDNEGVRKGVIKALGRKGKTEMLPVIVSCLLDKSVEVRKKALDAIGNILDTDVQCNVELKGKELAVAVAELKEKLIRESEIDLQEEENIESSGQDENSRDKAALASFLANQLKEETKENESEVEEESHLESEQREIEAAGDVTEEIVTEDQADEEVLVSGEVAEESQEEPEQQEVEAAGDVTEEVFTENQVDEEILVSGEVVEESQEEPEQQEIEAAEVAAKKIIEEEQDVDGGSQAGEVAEDRWLQATDDHLETDAKESLEMGSEEAENNEAVAREELREMVDSGEDSEPEEIDMSEKNLKKMVKPQLIAICQDLGIEFSYTMTKAQIVEKLLER